MDYSPLPNSGRVTRPHFRSPKTDSTVVLVVESEVLISMNTVQALENAGYLVLDAPHADGAIAILEQRSDVSAVLTDIDMPGSMDGLKLAHAIRGRWPPVHLIVASGQILSKDTELPLQARFIRKPYEDR